MPDGKYYLAQQQYGVCPVCGVAWASQPDFHCTCTRPRPGDAARAAAAAALSESARVAYWHGKQGHPGLMIPAQRTSTEGTHQPCEG